MEDKSKYSVEMMKKINFKEISHRAGALRPEHTQKKMVCSQAGSQPGHLLEGRRGRHSGPQELHHLQVSTLFLCCGLLKFFSITLVAAGYFLFVAAAALLVDVGCCLFLLWLLAAASLVFLGCWLQHCGI